MAKKTVIDERKRENRRKIFAMRACPSTSAPEARNQKHTAMCLGGAFRGLCYFRWK